MPKTPVVTGAWIDTPARQNQSSVPDRNQHSESLQHSKESQTDKPLPSVPSQPSHPRSVLEAVLQQANANHDERADDLLGDTTINSLRDLMREDPNYSNIHQLDEDTLDLINNVTSPVDQGDRQRQQEEQVLQRMAKTLRSTRSSLRDASRGMKRVEHQFEEAEMNENGHCKHCGYPEAITLTSILGRAWTSFLSNFYSWPKNGRLRITWLGVTCLVLFLWSISEVTLW